MYTSTLYLFTHMHSFIPYHSMATFRNVVYVAYDLTLLNVNIYDENAKSQCIRLERIHRLWKIMPR